MTWHNLEDRQAPMQKARTITIISILSLASFSGNGQNAFDDYPFYLNKVYKIMIPDREPFEVQFLSRDATKIEFINASQSRLVVELEDLLAVNPSKTDPFYNDPNKGIHVRIKGRGRQKTEGFVVSMNDSTLFLAPYFGPDIIPTAISYREIKNIRVLNYHSSLPSGFNSVVIGLGAGILLGVSGNIYAIIAAPFVTTSIILIGHNKNITKVKFSKSALSTFKSEVFH